MITSQACKEGGTEILRVQASGEGSPVLANNQLVEGEGERGHDEGEGVTLFHPAPTSLGEFPYLLGVVPLLHLPGALQVRAVMTSGFNAPTPHNPH